MEKCYEEIAAFMRERALFERYWESRSTFFRPLERVESLDWGNEALRTLVKNALNLESDNAFRMWKLQDDGSGNALGVWVRQQLPSPLAAHENGGTLGQ